MRIVSLISAGTEMLFALGLGEQVVGVSHECDWPAEVAKLPRVTRSNIDGKATSGEIDRQVRKRLAAGKALYEIDVELLARLEPGLIVTQSQCEVCAVAYEDVQQVVRLDARLKQTRLISLNPPSIWEMFDDMQRIGEAGGIGRQAAGVVRTLRAQVERLRRQAAAIPVEARPRVAIIEWTKPLMLAGNWVPEMVHMAGGRCELTMPGEHSKAIAWEKLIEFDPEVIVICPCGFDLARANDELRLLEHHAGWQSIAAVKAGRVHALDGNAFFNRPGPRLVDSLELLAEMVGV